MTKDRRARRPTQAELANMVGVSQVTVHRALTGSGPVKEETRKKVLKLARDHGYRLNTSASALRKGRFGNVALLQSTEPGRSTFDGLRGIQDVLDSENILLTAARLPDDQLTHEGFVPRILREWCADGLLINYTHHIPERMVQLIAEYEVPSVWINSKLPADCVHFDDEQGGRLATESLIERGHRHIAFIDLSHAEDELDGSHYSAHDRRAGYEKAMGEAGLTGDVVRGHTRVPAASRAAFAREWLSRDSRPTAVLAYSDRSALPVLLAARELGIAVPSELSIMAFSHEPVDRAGVLVSSVQAGHGQLGAEAAEMLLTKLDSPRSALSPTRVPFSAPEGDTVAPPAK